MEEARATAELNAARIAKKQVAEALRCIESSATRGLTHCTIKPQYLGTKGVSMIKALGYSVTNEETTAMKPDGYITEPQNPREILRKSLKISWE